MEYNRRKLRLGDILVKENVITKEQLEKSLEEQKTKDKKLGTLLVENGVVTELEIARALQKQLNLDMVELRTVRISDEIARLVPASMLKKHMVMPFAYSKDNLNIIKIAMADPMDILAIDDIAIVTNLQVEPVIATTADIIRAIDQYCGTGEIVSAAEEYAKEKESLHVNEEEILANENVNSSPVVKLVNTMIEQAVRQRASDIHIEALENKVRVRYRIDGVLYEKMTYNINLLAAIVARVKIIGGMDISEKRKPQDGRITMKVDRGEYDIRASVLPTVFGEKVVMRIANKMALTKEKRELGFSSEELRKFDHILRMPHGIILVTGPTGSGKSTTLYTALSELNNDKVNIITIEDPVEANIDGINQIQVNPKANLTFATALRSILRQDPDIIMIGEIRDAETASIAVQSSITGHLVVSTLHTNSSASTVVRLRDMGIEPYLIADSTVGVIAQRLVRRLCPHCKKVHIADVDEKNLLGVDVEQDITIYEPTGCSLCEETGYNGRIGVYEIMEVTPKLKHIIASGGDMEEIQEQALKEGMNTLKMNAANFVLQGVTSFSEMMKIAFTL
ncbi:type IV pilus assembly protein PilB [Lachnotalea glycerini]|uniref:Type II secretion system protein GspE n=1 Tax=Lachnotalea glycerini TaxID=1763509 RepID=A0A255IIR0_9FIRM|nr:ATPase, T2SS/T4P/T4SS family [Lachnotalea glycerini]PXV93309.1 type IV pilus assembly protein PilB [Lachnotalea glycerini]RDY31964.1 type II secretion system protein GspE [Lachnotalea glycerini]